MAFVQLERWDIPSGQARWLDLGSRAGALRWEPLWERFEIRRTIACIASLLFHVALLWFLIAHVFGADGSGGGTAASRAAMTLFNLPGLEAQAQSGSDSSAPDPTDAQAAAETPQTPQPPAQAAAAAPVTPPEWSMVKLPAKTGPTPSTTADAAAVGGGGSTAAQSGGAAGGGGDYDPYAGAAPHRRDSVGSKMGALLAAATAWSHRPDPEKAAPVRGSDTLVLDEALLADIRRRVAKANPGARGSIVLNLQVGGDGVVREARIAGVGLNSRLTDVLRSALIGRRLYHAGASNGGVQLQTLVIKFS